MHLENSTTKSDKSPCISKFETKKKDFKEKLDKVPLDIPKKIFKVYEQDLRTFGYGWNYVTKEIKNHLNQTDLKCSLTHKESADIKEIFQIGH